MKNREVTSLAKLEIYMFPAIFSINFVYYICFVINFVINYAVSRIVHKY